MIPSVDDQASAFADGLTRVARAVCPDAAPFEVDITGNDPWLASVGGSGSSPIVLTIARKRLLDLVVTYRCSMARGQVYLAIDRSEFKLRPHGGGEWLMRLDYERQPPANLPCSHLHVHAHRDAWTFLMSRDGRGSTRRAVNHRGDAAKTPTLADIHIPVGGPRLRPALEDFLTMLIYELGIDHTEDASAVLGEARVAWRTQQAQAIVSSGPDLAADVLRESGWTVTPPHGYQPAEALPPWFSRY